MRGIKEIPVPCDTMMAVVEAGGLAGCRRLLAAPGRGRVLGTGRGTWRGVRR